ncbi:hemocytin-like isoform X3 [Dermacentor albipictus]
MDFNVCESDCPLTCARPIPFFCVVHCARGCACPPGYVIDPAAITKGCVSAKACPPRCPRYSSFQQCVSTCEPRCDVLRPKKCVKHCHYGKGPVKCGHTEVAVRRWRRRDRFCRPMLTRPSLRWKRRSCICKRGYVRNAWNQCIPAYECNRCKRLRRMDYNLCETACPLTCGQPIPRFCSMECVKGCSCPPGYVIDPRRRTKSCISARWCPPKCPAKARFRLCVSTCEPRCDTPRPKKCVKRCYGGDCVCKWRYAKLFQRGQMYCVRRRDCPNRYKQLYGNFYWNLLGNDAY